MSFLDRQIRAAERRGFYFSAVTLELVQARAEVLARNAGRSEPGLVDVACAAYAARDHFRFQLELLAQARSLSGLGADQALGELSACEQLIATLAEHGLAP